MDIVGASLLLVLCAPLLVLVTVVLRLGEGPSVLFRQTRMGGSGRRFTILKFRTMREGAGALLTARHDPRVTRVGGVLRRLKIDELPQLWNVLRGDMSLVGPRPEVPCYVDTAADAYRRLGNVRPGLTDLASIVYHDEEDVLAAHAADSQFYERTLLPRKLALARLYRRRRSVAFDLWLLLVTGTLLTGRRGIANAMLGGRFVARARRGVTPDQTALSGVAHG